MALWELLVIAVGLSVDAFAVSVCQGLQMRNKINYARALLIALFFGGFQAAMPTIGYFLGHSLERYIRSFDHWIAFALLLFIGGHMIWEAIQKGDQEQECDLSLRFLTVMAFATSVDALAVGVTFAFLRVHLLKSVLIIGITTFILSFFGVTAGNRFGARSWKKAEIAGGAVLIGIGAKIRFEHLGILL